MGSGPLGNGRFVAHLVAAGQGLLDVRARQLSGLVTKLRVKPPSHPPRSVSESSLLGQSGDSSSRRSVGYTPGMKTAVSIPDDVFEKVERLVNHSRRSRSEVFSAALREYVARHAPDEVTEAMDRVCAEVNDQPDPFVSAAGRRVLERTEW